MQPFRLTISLNSCMTYMYHSTCKGAIRDAAIKTDSDIVSLNSCISNANQFLSANPIQLAITETITDCHFTVSTLYSCYMCI